MVSRETSLHGAGSQGEAIARVSQLWQIECRRLLGRLSQAEYRQALAALRQASGAPFCRTPETAISDG